MDMSIAFGNRAIALTLIPLYVWTALLVLMVLLVYIISYTRFRKCRVKHFWPVPIFGNRTSTYLCREHTAIHLQNLYMAYPEEKFVGDYKMSVPLIVIRDLELLEKVLIKDFAYFHDRHTVVVQDKNSFYGKCLVSLKGLKWEEMRSTLNPLFSAPNIASMTTLMEEAASHFINFVRVQIANDEEGCFYVDCEDLLRHYSADVIASCGFGLNVDSHNEDTNKFYQREKKIFKLTTCQIFKIFIYGILVKKFKFLRKMMRISKVNEKSKGYFKNLAVSTIVDRSQRFVIRHDFIQYLSETNKARPEDDLAAQTFIFFTGSKTVTIAMTFLLFELALNKEIQDKLAKEIRENFQKCHGVLTYESIQQMTYLDMVISELLRKWPPLAFVDRRCVEHYNLERHNNNAKNDYIIREGEQIIIPIWAIHRSPVYYSEPEKFNPERFSEDNKHNIKPFTYIPFGIGPRNCIATNFGLIQMKVMAYYLLQHVEVLPIEEIRLSLKLRQGERRHIGFEDGHWLQMRMRL